MSNPLDSAFTADRDSPGLLLWRVTNRWQARIREALAPFDLTHVQFVLLAALTWAGPDAALSQVELARRAGTDPMMTSQVLRALERKGLVRRDRHPDDGRARVLGATAAGVDLARRANRVVESADAAFFAAASDPSRTLLQHLHALDG